MVDREIDTGPGTSPNPPAMEGLRGAPKPAQTGAKKTRRPCARGEKETKPKAKTAGK